jgi:hypothetical protein
MKRSPPKLTLRRETLRALTSLDLTRAIGGDPALLADTGAEMCTRQAFTGAAMCTDQAAPKPPGG